MIGTRPVTSLGHQEGRRVFQEGPKFFELCPIFLNYVQHIFIGGEKIFLWGGFAPLVTGLIGTEAILLWVQYTITGDKRMQFAANYIFKNFGESWMHGYWPIIVRGFRRSYFRNGCNLCNF